MSYQAVNIALGAPRALPVSQCLGGLAPVWTIGGLPMPYSVAAFCHRRVGGGEAEVTTGFASAEVFIEQDGDDVAVLFGGFHADAAEVACGDD